MIKTYSFLNPLACLFVLLFSCLSLGDQPYKVEIISPYTQVQKEEKIPIALRIELRPEWYTYWSNPGDFGEKIQLKWSLNSKVTLVEKDFPTPKRHKYNIGNQNHFSFIYKKEVLIPFEVTIDKSFDQSSIDLDLNLEIFICKDICISKKEKLNLNLAIGDSFITNEFYKDLFTQWENKKPKDINLKSSFEKKNNLLLIHFKFTKPIECLDVFPRSSENFSNQKPLLLNQTESECTFQTIKSKSSLPVISGLLSYKEKNKTQSSVFTSHEKKNFHLAWFILMAFLGGLILNIMPCVLPIIFLKFYNTLEMIHQPKRKIIILNLSYVFGVILSFLGLAFFILLSKKAGESIGWGFHLQSPLFVTSLSLLFLFMAFYLLNWFQIPLPKASINFKSKKIFSHFLTGVLSTTAASPCTVPFMASAVGFAFSRSYIEIFSIFFFLGLGLSFPYLLLSFFPSFFKHIPTPKKWMNTLKHSLSFPLFLTVLWFIYLIHKQLDFQIFLMTLLIYPLSFLFILFQNQLKESYAKAGLLFFLSLSTIGLLTLQWTLNQSVYNTRQSLNSENQFKKPTKNMNWKLFSKDNLDIDRKYEKKILVAIGAEWCLTCKLSERVFQSKEVIQFLNTNDITLYYGDWTNRNANITSFLDSYGQKGIPFYILYNGEESTHILPTLLLKKSFLQKLNSFFLE